MSCIARTSTGLPSSMRTSVFFPGPDSVNVIGAHDRHSSCRDGSCGDGRLACPSGVQLRSECSRSTDASQSQVHSCRLRRTQKKALFPQLNLFILKYHPRKQTTYADKIRTFSTAFLPQSFSKKRSHRSISASFPLAISSASRAKSWYITRSCSIVAHTDRIAACAACPRFEVFSAVAA
jgi:hypothetical protein